MWPVLSRAISKSKELLNTIMLCSKISWEASKLFTIIRLLFRILEVIVPFANLYLFKLLLDLLTNSTDKNSNIETIPIIIVIIVGVGAIKIIANVLRKIKDVLSSMHNDKISNYVNMELSKISSKLDIFYFESSKFNNDIVTCKRDASSISTLIWSLIDSIAQVITVTVSIIILAKYSLIYSIILLLAVVPMMLNEKKYTQKLYKWQKDRVPEERKMNYILNVVTGKGYAKDIRLYNIGQYLINRYKDMWAKYYSERKSILRIQALVTCFLSAIPDILVIFITISLAISVINQYITIGDYSYYQGMIGQVSGSVFSLIFAITKIYEDRMRVFNFMNVIKWENHVESTGQRTIVKINSIEFKNVFFKYPETEIYVLKNVNIKILSNEKIAIVGVNGAGKSTITKLLMRFYDVNDGYILINGININEYEINQLRSCFSTMFQDYLNYAFTLKENITISNLEKQDDIEKIQIACQQSGVNSLIDKWEDGLDTYIFREYDEKGKGLSGGEGQKIALARTFFRSGSVLIFDEPSSSLDPEAENRIVNFLNELAKNKISILISHRLSNVISADKIIVIENGEIVEMGSHDELMEINGRYRVLFNYQADNYVSNKKG